MYCGKVNSAGRPRAHFDITSKGDQSENRVEGEIDTSLCNLDDYVQYVFVKDLQALPRDESQEKGSGIESLLSGRDESKAVCNDDVISGCRPSPELPESTSSEEDNRRQETSGDISVRTPVGSSSKLSSMSVSEPSLPRPKKGPSDLPVSKTIEEPHTNKGASGFCNIDVDSNASAVNIPYSSQEDTVRNCDTDKEYCDISGQNCIPRNTCGFSGNFVTLYVNMVGQGESKRIPIAEFAVEVNDVTVIIKEFEVPWKEEDSSASENMNVDINEDVHEDNKSQEERHSTNERETTDDYEQLIENKENQEQSSKGNHTGETSKKKEKDPIKCIKCPSSYMTIEAMLTHFMKCHISTKCIFKCPYKKCSSTISYKTTTTHLRSHIERGIYNCPHCSFSASHKGGFSRHIAAHKSG